MALGTLIVESDYDSGAMFTAHCALEQGREVFVVPGSIFSPQSRGPHSLLKDGATTVASTNDVLEALNLTMVGAQLDFGRAMPPTDPASEPWWPRSAANSGTSMRSPRRLIWRLAPSRVRSPCWN